MFVGFCAIERISTNHPNRIQHSWAYFGMLTILIPMLLKSSTPCKYCQLDRWRLPRRRKREGWFRDTNTAKYRFQPASRLSMLFLRIARLSSCNNSRRFIHISGIFRHVTPPVSSPTTARGRSVLTFRISSETPEVDQTSSRSCQQRLFPLGAVYQTSIALWLYQVRKAE